MAQNELATTQPHQSVHRHVSPVIAPAANSTVSSFEHNIALPKTPALLRGPRGVVLYFERCPGRQIIAFHQDAPIVEIPLAWNGHHESGNGTRTRSASLESAIASMALTDAYATPRRERKKIEMLFAHLKRILKLDRLRLRGPNGAKTSSSWPPPPRTFESLPS